MIEVANLTRYYGDFPALRDVSFRVAEGQIIGLLGLNGAGKSTTLKILAGLIPPSSGTVLIEGHDIVDDPASLRSRIGYLPEDPPLYTDMTVAAFVAYIGRMKGMSAADVARRLPEVLATSQLTDRADQVIAELSHGFRKRVGIAQAIIHDPRLVILDEPISGLDPVQIVEMRKVIRSLGRKRVVMVSSHILSEIHETCDRIIVLRDGMLVAEGTEEELTRQVTQDRLRVAVRGGGDFGAWLTARDDVAAWTADHSRAGETTVVVTLATDARETLAADLIAAGFGLRTLEEAEPALEEIFLGLTREGEA